MENVENSNNDQQVAFQARLNDVNAFSPQALVKPPVKDETYRRVEQLGAKTFGEHFFGAYEMIMGERDVFVIAPEEFFFREEGLNGKLTEQQEKAQKDFFFAQQQLQLDFYRKNMGIFSVDGIVSTLQNMDKDIDPEVLKEALLPSVEEAVKGKDAILHKTIL